MAGFIPHPHRCVGGRRQYLPALVALWVGAGVAALAGSFAAPADAQQRPPNVVVVMTDDQTAASLAVMDNVRSELGAQGVTFNNSFVNFPACCPSRATFLTGQYAHNHGILGNRPPEGGFEKFNAMHGGNMLADWLQGGGYYTAHIGKYLNGYGEVDPALVPEGWNEWYAGVGEADAQEFYDYLLNENGSLVGYGSAPQDYKGDVITGKAVEFIGRRAPASEPFFLSVAYNAPHVGEPYPPGDPCVNAARPAPRHAGAFADEPLPRPPSFYEEDVSDKPRFIRVKDPLSGGLLAWTTRTYRCNLESLLSVDEGVGEIVAALRDSGELGDTYVIFTSDNGYFYGEHRIRTGKVFVYEESIRVPLLIRGPGVPPGQTVSKLVTNADLAPTVLDAAGVQPDLVQDGQSLLGSIAGRLLLVENPTYATYTAVRTPRYLYVEHTTGERELYDLEADPYQLQSLHENPAYRVVMAWMAQRLGELRGCAGASCLDSAGSACTILGSSGDDVLTGTPGDDVICSLGGNDVLEGAGGNDLLRGGHGIDRLFGDADVDALQGEAGRDTLAGGGGSDTLQGAAGSDTLAGDDDDDALDGGMGTDVLQGGTGADTADYATRTAPLTVSIGDGPDDGEAGEGDDVQGDVEHVTGGTAGDTLIGSGAANRLTGGAGTDALAAGAGDDVLDGGFDADVLQGGAGADTAGYATRTAPLTVSIGDGPGDGEASEGDDVQGDVEHVTGGIAGDTLIGSDAPNRMAGGPGNDSLHGEAGTDALEGGGGKDDLDGGQDADVVQGGASSDTADYTSRTAPLTVTIGAGPDDGERGEGDDVQGDVEHVTGGTAGDTLIGSGAANRLTGGAGTDALAGGGGNDALGGGPDADVMQGGGGSDNADYGSRTAPLTVSIGDGPGDGEAGEGDDVQGDVEHVTGGTAGDTLIGSGAANRLTGGAGTDALGGGGGNDALDGGMGADVLQGGTGADTADYASRTAPLTVSIGDGPGDGEAGEGDDVQGDVERVTGGIAGDTLIGSDASNRMAGGAGGDALTGGAGNDTLLGDVGDDALDARDSPAFTDGLLCGPGTDIHFEDPADSLTDCE